MNGGLRIAGGRPASADELLLSEDHVSVTVAPAAAPPPPMEHLDLEEDLDDAEGGPRGGWLWPAVAILASLAWLGGMVWLALPAIRAGLEPLALIQLVAALAVVPALIGIVYLLALRTSSAEARRWSGTARAMRSEAASLERTVSGLSERIEANRAALAEQTRMLLSMGDGAVERLQAIANGMGEQAKAIELSARTLADAGSSAERSAGIALSTLPKAHAELTGVKETLDAAGLAASERAAALEGQLASLAERGREADHIAGGAAQRLAANMARMEATSESAGVRLEQVTADMTVAVDGVLDRAAQAVDEARKGIAAQGDAMLAMLSTNQAALDRTARDTVEALSGRVATIEQAIDRIGDLLRGEHVRSEALFDTLGKGIASVDTRFGEVHASGMERTQALAASLSALTGSADAMTEAMRTGETTARTVIGTAEELLTALDAAAREIDETLPDALARLDARIGASRKVVADAKPELLALVTAAESTHEAIEAIAGVVSQQRDMLTKMSDALIETLDSGRGKADQIEAIVDSTIAHSKRFAENAAPQLVDALLRIKETSTTAAEQARATLGSMVPEAARALEDAGARAIRRAVESAVKIELSQLNESAEAAVTTAARASERLSQQMLAIAEATEAVNQRIMEARDEREKSNEDNFARRVSLLIEALNSASIDIAKTFSREVSDSSWAAYLKGDRGVFTRRAVRLLDASEAREIVRLYDDDDGFREQVNRYIHDFEAMLRQILTLRDGSPLGVTLLSSDMGKLYVALAQAIERLRA